jgi:hypothetical protein
MRSSGRYTVAVRFRLDGAGRRIAVMSVGAGDLLMPLIWGLFTTVHNPPGTALSNSMRKLSFKNIQSSHHRTV